MFAHRVRSLPVACDDDDDDALITGITEYMELHSYALRLRTAVG